MEYAIFYWSSVTVEVGTQPPIFSRLKCCIFVNTKSTTHPNNAKIPHIVFRIFRILLGFSQFISWHDISIIID